MTSQSDTSSRPRRIIDPWLLSVAVFWGLNAVSNKWLLETIQPAGILAFRFVNCALVVSAAAWYLGRRRPPGPRPVGMMILVGAWVGLQQFIFIHALAGTTASEASLIVSIAPIWTAIIGAAVGAEIVTRTNWVGILAAAGGVVMIVLGGGGLHENLPGRVGADLWMVLSSLLYGGFMVYSKGIMKRYGALRVMSWAFAFGSLLILPTGAPQFFSANWTNFSLAVWGCLLYSAYIAGGYGFVLWYYTIARSTPAKTAVYQYLVPVVALVGAAVFLGERLTALQIAGAAVVITGVILARRPANCLQSPP